MLDPKKGGPYTKLIMHFETQGDDTTDNDMDCEWRMESCISSDEEDSTEYETDLTINLKTNTTNVRVKLI